MASILIAGLLTLVLGFAIGWLAAWVASLRATGATLSVLWGRVLAAAGVLAAVLAGVLVSPLVDLPFQPDSRWLSDFKTVLAERFFNVFLEDFIQTAKIHNRFIPGTSVHCEDPVRPYDHFYPLWFIEFLAGDVKI